MIIPHCIATMSNMEQLSEVKQILEQELHFRILDGDDAFLLLLDDVGIAVFRHCVELVKLWQQKQTTGRERYLRLMALMRMMRRD